MIAITTTAQKFVAKGRVCRVCHTHALLENLFIKLNNYLAGISVYGF